jgi:hypothetical protein
MSRTRTALAALVAVVLVGSALALVGGPAQARAAKKPVRPKVGQCRTTTYAQALNAADPRKPVPCSKPHRLKTFAVLTMPKGYTRSRQFTNKIGTFAYRNCLPRFWKALGGTHAQRDQTAYGMWVFIPTKAEMRKGARWLRCDLALDGARADNTGFLAPLPNVGFPVVGNRPITDATRRCLNGAPRWFITPCSSPHAARADQTFTMPGTAAPTAAQIKAAAAEQCPGKRYTSPGAAWRLGDHVIVCYSLTTD